VQAEQEGGTLKVDQVRELQHALALSPYEARYRVALLLRCEEARASAANALLKTLEEPPPQVVLMLTAESAESVLPTIVSRCEVLRLRPLPLELVSEGLQAQWGLPAEQARLLAHISGGRPGYALRLCEAPQEMEQRQSWLKDLFTLLPANRVERFAYARTVVEQKDVLRSVLLTWLSLWRDVLLCTAGTTAPLTNVDWSETVREMASHLELAPARAAVAAVERTLGLLERNVNARLAFEVLLLDLPQMRVTLSA
jgi:DNA polymerase-3 subunit delta'